MRRSFLFLPLLCAFAMACASGGAKTGATSATSSSSKSASNSPTLSSADIVAADLPTAYDLVDRLRRPWLRSDPASGAAVSVYMDNQNLGGTSSLRDIPSAEVSEMQFLRSADAIARYGQDAKGGAIIIIRKR